MKGFKDELHVVAFDVPFPANYGGVIDIFYKIKALSEEGVKIHLHAYTYGRKESNELEAICESVTYYRRKVFKNPIYNKKPYIVASRNSTPLIENLTKDKLPILFEGLHSTFYLADPRLKDRYKIVRTHNVEHDYYNQLEKVETNRFKKYFFKIEAERLRKYEQVLKHANLIAAISPNDYKYFNRRFENVIYLPPFHINDEVSTLEGKGEFLLYHGNLEVGENNAAAQFLVTEVFSQVKYPCLIAGNNPSDELVELVKEQKHVNLVDGLDSEKINELIRQAQINVLYTKQATGIKLKLINALYMGKYCLANNEMAMQTGLEGFCQIANSAKDFVSAINNLWNKEFDKKSILERSDALTNLFSNTKSIELLLGHLKSKNNRHEPSTVVV